MAQGVHCIALLKDVYGPVKSPGHIDNSEGVVLTEEPVQVLRCPSCGRELVAEDYLCETCGFCQYCCKCSSDTSPESTLAAD